MDVVDGVVVMVGPLLGVGVGGWLTHLQHTRSWRREQHLQRRAERLAAYVRFITGGRSWQSNVLEPGVQIVTAHTGIAYADAGSSYPETIRALAEVRLVAGQNTTVAAAVAWEQALRTLSEVRAAAHPGPAPADVLQRVRDGEDHFIAAARRELGSPHTDDR